MRLPKIEKQDIFYITLLFSIVIMNILSSLQTNYIFYPEKLSQNYQFANFDKICTEVMIKTPDGETINGLFFDKGSEHTILYFHGNAGSLSSWQYVYRDLEFLGFNLLIIDYRGYGKSSGQISETGLYTDAQASFDYLLGKGFKKEKIIIYGRSIGTGVAVELAQKQEKVGALILETPYTSFGNLANYYMPYLVPSLWLSYEFDNMKKINDVKCPLLVLHGTFDEVIPFHQGETLFKHFQGSKKMVRIDAGNHNNLSLSSDFKKGLSDFFEEFGK